jgi:hypothetical protein
MFYKVYMIFNRLFCRFAPSSSLACAFPLELPHFPLDGLPDPRAAPDPPLGRFPGESDRIRESDMNDKADPSEETEDTMDKFRVND